MRALIACTVALLLATVACRSDQRTYTLHGQVYEVAADRKQAVINHEEIKGFMAAMTMPYKVKDTQVLADITAGDMVDATLVVASNEAYLTVVKKVGHAPVPKAEPETAVQPAPTSSGFELLKPGEAVPEAHFVDENGKKRVFSAFKGSTVVLTFIYTRCPLPTFCPLMDRHFQSLQKTFAADPALKNVQLVSISFDPITDTPAVLKKHAKELAADPARWSFFTGDRDDIDQFAARFGVSISRALNDALDITHNLRTAIIDSDGKLVKAYTGNEWTPEQLLADLKPVVRTN